MLTQNGPNQCRTVFEENIVPEDQTIEKHVKTFLDMLILAMLNGKSTYGYHIIAAIHTEFGILLSPASLYPLLHTLENGKLIEANTERGKTVYRLTQKGKENFGKKFMAYNLSIQIMKNFMKSYEKI
jgi:DNA-binding PadR family transcriptional regulator